MADTLITGTTIVESSTKSDGDVPVGGIIAWLNSISGVPNLPLGWKLCDGTIVNDALSPMNGETVPDLNGDNRFLRGSDTAGGTGGSSTHTLTENEMPSHTHNWEILNGAESGQTVVEFTAIDGSPNFQATTSTGGDAAHENKPPYINVVMIIRIR